MASNEGDRNSIVKTTKVIHIEEIQRKKDDDNEEIKNGDNGENGDNGAITTNEAEVQNKEEVTEHDEKSEIDTIQLIWWCSFICNRPKLAFCSYTIYGEGW